MNHIRWNNLISNFGISKDNQTYNALVNRYTERGRFYHNVRHITEMLSIFDQHLHLVHQQHQVELAIWFHDAVYDISSSSNEQDSALLAEQFLLKHGVSRQVTKQVYQLICSTAHNTHLTDNDQMLLTDIDLAILGADKDVFDRYEQNIRQEYAEVDLHTYNTGRRHILTRLNHKASIYYTREFQKTYEIRARYNLSRAIQKLSTAE